MRKSAVTPDDARRFAGQPVCVVMKDGSYYVGWITGVQQNHIVLSGHKGAGKIADTPGKQGETATASAWLTDFMTPSSGGGWGGNLFGFPPAGPQPPGGTAGAGASGGGFMNMIKTAWPSIQMGIGMVRMIMPLLSGLRL